jgi:hypothetical protein
VKRCDLVWKVGSWACCEACEAKHAWSQGVSAGCGWLSDACTWTTCLQCLPVSTCMRRLRPFAYCSCLYGHHTLRRNRLISTRV